MPWARVNAFDSAGSAGDLPDQSLSPNVLTDLSNVRLVDGAIEKCKGMTAQYGTPPITPYYLQSVQDSAGVRKIFLAGLTAIYEYASGSYTDISRAVGGAYSATVDNVWTGGILHGILVLNNPNDTPQSWDSVSGKMVDLPNWPAGYKAGALRPFKNFLFALNINDGTALFPFNVMWSHPADPGSVPASWDVTDPTKDAGVVSLSDTPGQVVDGMALGDVFVIYKEDAICVARFTGAPYIFSVQTVVRDVGVMARNCIGEVLGRHVILTANDVMLFDGTSVRSIISRKWRRRLFSNIADFQKSFIATNSENSEVWVCISTTAGAAPTLAFVWSWDLDRWTIRTIPQTQSIAQCFAPDVAGDSWASSSGSWDSDTGKWSSVVLRARTPVLAGVSPASLLTLNDGELLDTTVMSCFAQHTSYDFATPDKADLGDVVKHVSKLRPKVNADSGVVLYFSIGTQMNLSDPIAWTPAQTFTVGTTKELCFSVNGRYISWKVSSATNKTWRLEALDALVEFLGRF